MVIDGWSGRKLVWSEELTRFPSDPEARLDQVRAGFAGKRSTRPELRGQT